MDFSDTPTPANTPHAPRDPAPAQQQTAANADNASQERPLITDYASI